MDEHDIHLEAQRLAGQLGGLVLATTRWNGSPMGAMVSPSQGGQWRVTWFDEFGFAGNTTPATKEACILLCLEEGYTDSNRNLLRELSRLESFHEGCERMTAVARMHGGWMTNAQAAVLVCLATRVSLHSGTILRTHRGTETMINRGANGNQTKPVTKMQVKKLMQTHGIPGELSGAGEKWEVELPSDAAKKAFVKKVAKVGGYRCGYGGWVLRPGYTTDGLDYCNPASRHHY